MSDNPYNLNFKKIVYGDKTMLHVSVLMDDIQSRYKPLEAEKGLSMLVDFDGTRLLFDTGYDDKFIGNAKMMGYTLDDLDGVILSNAHFNHVGGYNALLDNGLAPKSLFIGNDFFAPKFIKDGPVYSNLATAVAEERILKEGIKPKEIQIQLKLTNSLYLITCSDNSPYATLIPESHMKYKEKRFVKDNYSDEIALVAVTKAGLIVLAGRCNKGICNMVHYIRKTSSRKIAAIIGGMEPNFESKELSYLEESGVKFIGICSSNCDIENIPNSKIKIERISVGDEFFF